MNTVTIAKDRTTTYTASTANTLYVLDGAATIDNAAIAGIMTGYTGGNRDFLIRGDITSPGSAIKLYGANNDVVVAKAGSLQGSYGVDSAGDNFSLVNAGMISGTTAVKLSGHDNLIDNAGTISGSSWAIDTGMRSAVIHNDGLITAGKTAITTLAFSGETVRIVNEGTIQAVEYGIASGNLTGGTTILVNEGTVSGSFWSYVSTANLATDIIINRGIMTGQIMMGAGNDRYDGRGGQASYVAGDAGDDTYIIDDALIVLSEGASLGTDTVRSSVTWTLGTNFEHLTLIGTDSIAGKGNAQMNRLTGNSGQNTLYGYDNSDILNGRKGNDFLYGGNGADTFVFATGSGKDTIEDFANGLDLIDLTGIKGLDTFGEITSAMTQVGSDVHIALGGNDLLVVRNITVAALGIDDFAF